VDCLSPLISYFPSLVCARLGRTHGIVSPFQPGVCYDTSDNLLLSKPLKLPPPNAAVYVNVFSNSIRKISAVDASFQFDAFVSVAWKDERFNATFIDFMTSYLGDDSNSYSWAQSLGGFEPSLEFGNAIPVTAVPTSYFMQQGAPSWTGVADSESAWIVSQGRATGTFLQPQSLKDFPFDTQTASVTVQSNKWPSSVLRIVIAPTAVQTVMPLGDIDGWNKKSGKTECHLAHALIFFS
jgi:hypothetical protein